jgi:hypothetical protein
MRRPAILISSTLTLALAAACGGHEDSIPAATTSGAAGGSASAATAPGASRERPRGDSMFTAEVAGVDPSGRNVTLRTRSTSAPGASAAERTIRVDGAATSALASLEAGDEVVVACDSLGASAGDDLAACTTVTAVTRVASR